MIDSLFIEDTYSPYRHYYYGFKSSYYFAEWTSGGDDEDGDRAYIVSHSRSGRCQKKTGDYDREGQAIKTGDELRMEFDTKDKTLMYYRNGF